MEKPSLALIIAKKAAEKKAAEKGEGSEDSEKKYEEMGAELLKHAKADDAAAFGKALKDFVKVCGAE